MKTSFTLAQLADDDIAKADEIIRKCVHCGFCTAHCPTYQLLGNELDSPRGRIQLFKEALEEDRAVSPAERAHLDRCLTCGACNSVCPSGVDYLSLAEIGRAHIETKGGRSVADKAVRKSISSTMRNPSTFKAGLFVAPLGKLVKPLLPKPAKRMLEVLPKRETSKPVAPGWHKSTGVMNVGLFQSCVQPSLKPQIDQAAVRVLNALGVDVFVGQADKCCGALDRHLGHAAKADALEAEAAQVFAGHDLDAITYTVSGCGPTLMGMHEKAVDLAELVASLAPKAVRDVSAIKVAAQSPCTQQHGAKKPTALADVLGPMGFQLAPIVDPHLCCGAAGTYTLLQPELSDQLGHRKGAALKSSGADIAVSANIGCLTHLERFETLPILHWIELVEWAIDIHATSPSHLLGN